MKIRFLNNAGPWCAAPAAVLMATLRWLHNPKPKYEEGKKLKNAPNLWKKRAFRLVFFSAFSYTSIAYGITMSF